MKKLLCIFASCILFYGCSVSSTNNEDNGTVKMTLPASSRSIASSVTSYTINVSCENIKYSEEYTGYPGDTLEIVNLIPETYFVEVKGFGENKKELLKGSTTVEVLAGKTSEAKLKLNHTTGKISIEIQLPDEEEEEPEVIDGWRLTFKDDFNGDTIDPLKWSTWEYIRKPNAEGPDGWWNKDDVYLSGIGQLVIRTRKIDNKNDETTNDNDTHDYSTGMVRTKGNFEQKYGKYEIRCKLPTQDGWMVAFWLFSESVANVDGSGKDGTEVDIFEGFGNSNLIQHALHYDGYNEGEHKMVIESQSIPNIKDGYHTFGLEWTPEEYIFFVDGKETWRSNFGGVSQVPAYVKISGEFSKLNSDSENYFANNPDYFFVDYIKVYEKITNE